MKTKIQSKTRAMRVVHPFIAEQETHHVQFPFSVELMEYLLENHHPMNRPINRDRVDATRSDIRNGNWNPATGNCIKFDVLGNIIDGHHRITGHIEENVPMVSSVIYGLPVEAINYQDTNRPRSAANNAVLLRSRISNTLPTDADNKAMNLRYRIGKWMAIGLRLKDGTPNPFCRTSDAEQAIFLDKHETEISFAQDAAQNRYTTRPGFLSALAIYYRHNPRRAVAFRQEIVRGVNASEPVVALRDYLMKKSTGGSQPRFDHFNTVHAINCFHNGKPIDTKFPHNTRTSWMVD